MRCLPLLFALCLLPQVSMAQGLAGAYLAGNQANRDNNYAEASRYYAQALSRDPNNPFLLQNALLAFVAKGDVDYSLAIAKKVAASDIGGRLADLVLLTDAIKEGDYSEASAILDSSEDRMTPLMFGLLRGWIALGEGRMGEALARFDAMDSPTAMQLFGQYHKALALAMVGDFGTANEILLGDENGSLRLNRASLIAHAQIMSQLGQTDEALELLDGSLAGTQDEELQDLRDRIVADGVVDYDFMTDPSHGAAEVFLTLARLLDREENERRSLVNARLAQYLRPDHTETVLLTAEVLQDQEQYELAIRTYAQVSQDDPNFLNAELGRADALLDADKPDAAIEVLRGLVRSHGHIPRVHMTLGDAYRFEERYGEAAEVYDTAVAMIEDDAQQNHWFLYYARGIAYERLKQWDIAEPSFRRALELQPDHPLVLNYLGYSLVEFRTKLDEAQQMIETAVARRPDDGYITDSLGWVLYRLGKFEEAVAPMERAVELVSDDPIINDHLGDVYWMVGRKREARFQWKRAMSFDPEEEDLDRIRRKLEVGLDAVLREEEALETAQGDDG